jgi:ribosomal protein L37AE/L43A
MTSRINNPESCICCARRADGVAVGRPEKLAWYCLECGPEMAKIALAMHTRAFDALEKSAALAVANDAGGAIEVPDTEAPAFILWVVEQFAQNMRKQIADGGAPF